MTKAQLERSIMCELKNATNLYDDFHGYYGLDILENAIFKAMFGHLPYTHRHHYDRSIRKGWDTFEDNYTAEEKSTYLKIKDRMIKAGVITISKSGKMFKLAE